MIQQTVQQQSFEIARKVVSGWVPIAISEKKRDPTWGEEGRCFMVALRKPEHAHIPFDSSTPDDIPNLALVFMWQGEKNHIVLAMENLFEFSHNPIHPTITTCMHSLLTMAQEKL